MKDLLAIAAVAIAAALVVIAAAFYNTWTEAHMTIATVAASLACLAIPVSAGVATYLAMQQRQDQHDEAEREKRIVALLEEQRRVSAVTLVEQRQQTEALRTERQGRLLAAMQPGQIAAPGNPWAPDDWDDGGELAPISL